MNRYSQVRELPVAAVGVDERATFVTRTYGHLLIAVVGFVLCEWWLFQSGLADRIAALFARVNWIFVLGAFMLVSWIATRAAHATRSLSVQYTALFGFVAAHAVIFVPLLRAADRFAPGTIQSAAAVTLAGFTALTAVAVWTRKDFSFLGAFIRWGAIFALVAIGAGFLFGFGLLGTWFSVFMVTLASAAILRDTERVIKDYPQQRFVAAALQLFASVAMMFWYVLRLFTASRH